MRCSFDLAHYRELLGAAVAGGYRFAFFDAPPRAGEILLRHDVDLSLDAALAMAELESELEAPATYLLMTRSEFYNLSAPSAQQAIDRLRRLGPRVGLHAVYPQAEPEPRLDTVLAWHSPDPDYMTARVAGFVNAMQPGYFDPEHYRSDSNQRWRHGCPHEPLARGEFEWLSGGLMWSDEFPSLGTPERQAMSQAGAVGCLLAARAAVTLGQESGFLPVWEQVARHAPNWPGLRPERRGEAALRRLRAALRRQDRCLAALETQLGANPRQAEPGAAPDPAN